MSTFTENYNLIKPDGDDYYDITDFNENMDTLDELMAAAETEMASVAANVSTVSGKADNIIGKVDNVSSKVDTVSSKVDTVSSKVTTVQNSVNSIATKIGSPAQSGQTLFSLLSQSGFTFSSIFKSVQRVTITSPTKSVAINTVNPAKCLVYVERLYNNSSSSLFYYDYVLEATQITMTEMSSSNNSCRLAFNIIEFY